MARILITEDDPLMLRMYQKVFTLEKYEVDIAGNGEEALERVRANKPTLILMDIMMPKMNGLDALDKLKANPDTAQIPVIMLTNLAGQQDAEEALLKGAVKYIVKSEHDPKQVVDLVKEILAGYTRDKVPEAVLSNSSNMKNPVQAPVNDIPNTPQVGSDKSTDSNLQTSQVPSSISGSGWGSSQNTSNENVVSTDDEAKN